MTDIEINQDYECDEDGEIGGPMDVFWCRGHETRDERDHARDEQTMDIRVLSTTFTYEHGEGVRYRDDHRGARLLIDWNQYDRAFTEADNPTRRIDFVGMRIEDAPVTPTYSELLEQVETLTGRLATLREILG